MQATTPTITQPPTVPAALRPWNVPMPGYNPSLRRQMQRHLDAELATARAELARADAKTATLLGLAGVLLGGGVAVLGGAGRHLPAAAVVSAWTTAATVGAAVVLLFSAIRPRLGNSSFGFVRWCRTRDTGQLLDELAADVAGNDRLAASAGQLRWLSCTLVAKYVAVRRAVTLLIAGLGTGAVTAVVAMWTR